MVGAESVGSNLRRGCVCGVLLSDAALSLKAFAKINTQLRVGQLRASGLHDILSVVEAIDLYDTITLRPAEAMRVTCSVEELSGESNIVAKAIRLMKEVVDVPPLAIHIEKQIPIQAGLGGGSSDAAAAIRGASALAGHSVPKAVLQDVALACGSDVPFFLGESTAAVVSGCGQVRESLESRPRLLCIAKPSTGVSTAGAYSALDRIGVREDLGDITDPNALENDFDAVAPAECLDIMERMVNLGAECAHLCGSGSAVYGLFTDEERCNTAQSRFEQAGMWSRVCKTLDRWEHQTWMR